MNARTSRFLSCLLVTAIALLAGCATRQDTLYVPSEAARYGGYTTGGGYGYGQLPPREVFRRGPGGCTVTRYDSAIPFTVAVPCVSSENSVSQGSVNQSGQLIERSRYERSILDGLIAQARQQLQEVCDPKTVNARMTAEALVTGVMIGAIGRTSQAVAGGAAVGALSGFARGGIACQRAVDWHHELLLELSKEVRYQREVRDPQCSYTLSERTGQSTNRTRDCREQAYENWRR